MSETQAIRTHADRVADLRVRASALNGDSEAYGRFLSEVVGTPMLAREREEILRTVQESTGASMRAIVADTKTAGELARTESGPRDANVPEICAGEADLAETLDAAWHAIQASNQPPTLFRRDSQIVAIAEGAQGAVIHPLGPYAVQEQLARRASWFVTRDGRRCPARSPIELARIMCATDPAGLPEIERVIRTPIVAPSGRVVDREGYDPETRTWYAPGSLRVAPVSEAPSEDEIASARNLLAVELLGDFPFTGAADLAGAVALLLLPFSRELIDGATPLHLLEKPSPGSGASLVMEAIGHIACGGPPGFMAEGGSDDEWRKRITSTLIDGPTVVVIDNVRRRLDSGALAKALTDRVWIDRRLGESRNVAVPVRCCWAVTANNPAVSSEIARRSVPIRIDAKVDRPWERRPESFRHPKLIEWVSAHRGELVHAALTLVRAWVAAGRPEGRESMGSYERWAAVLGGVLGVAGVPGLLQNRTRFYDRADREIALWRAFVGLWWEKHGGAPVGVKDLWPMVDEVEAPFDLGKGGERSQKTRLGDALRGNIDRRFTIDGATMKIEAAGTLQRAAQYRLVSLSEPSEPSEPREPLNLLADPHARARAREEVAQKGSPGSRGSQNTGACLEADAESRAERLAIQLADDVEEDGEHAQ
jgi:putative DNA primase/helicase